MTTRPVVPRTRALVDIEAAADYYADEAGEEIALRFIDALDAAFSAIARNPAMGSPRYQQELDLPGLRHQLVRGFPFLIFYVELEDRIDIWRVLHAHRDIPGTMADPEA